MKKVLLLTTGGTIASAKGEEGLSPALSSGVLLRYISDLSQACDIKGKDLLSLDSSNIQAEDWQLVAGAVYNSLEDFDGFVITHGTNTMAYTSSMLSFMLQNLKKPVVLTGSQVPIDYPFSDAKDNLRLALAAVDSSIHGVTVAFNRKIINGCRAVKVRTTGFDAFESVNAPCLGELFPNGLRRFEDFRPEPGERAALRDSICPDVFLLKLIPGTRPEVFDMLYSMKYRGIVIEAFGLGGLDYLRRSLLPKLEMLTENGVPVVVCSQCLYEASDLSVYEVGRMLLGCGVISGWDMTTEAAVTKLMWALGQTDKPGEIRRIFETNYAGEIDPSNFVSL
ncbi:MAG: asparaginase [Oscillospiraceae bacterium]|jgi:L-asparaginase